MILTVNRLSFDRLSNSDMLLTNQLTWAACNVNKPMQCKEGSEWVTWLDSQSEAHPAIQLSLKWYPRLLLNFRLLLTKYPILHAICDIYTCQLHQETVLSNLREYYAILAKNSMLFSPKSEMCSPWGSMWEWWGASTATPLYMVPAV